MSARPQGEVIHSFSPPQPGDTVFVRAIPSGRDGEDYFQWVTDALTPVRSVAQLRQEIGE